jgi:hypothetical protein
MAKKSKPDQEKDIDPKSPVIDLEAQEIRDMDRPAADARAEEAQPEFAAERETAQETPPPPESSARKSRSSGMLWGGIALLALAAIGGAWAYQAYGSRYWPTDEMKVMAGRVSTLEAENKTLKDQLRGVAAAVDEIKSSAAAQTESASVAKSAAETALQNSTVAQDSARNANEKLASLESQIGSTHQAIDALKAAIAAQPPAEGGQAAPAPVIDTAALNELRARVEGLEKDVTELRSKGGAPGAETATLLSQTLADLKGKLAAGAPYPEEAQRIANLVPAAPGLDVLSGLAANGVPTAEMLGQEAQALAAELPAPAGAASPDAAETSYWDQLLGALGSVVKVRNIGETDWRTVAAKAGEAAAAGNLQDALTLANGEGEIPNALRIWREKVQARINADAAIEDLSSAVLRQISAIGGQP